jgi:hypothetical protein
VTPFLTFYTPTFRRPQALAACMTSVAKQTDVAQIEHLIVADYVGIGIAGMYARVPQYAASVHGDYVHLLADDDELAHPSVVGQVHDFAISQGYPAIILVAVIKDGLGQIAGVWPPVEGEIDLGNLIVRGDIWHRHCADYGKRYEGDADFARALFAAGYEAARLPLLFLRGGVRRGQPEVCA